jgi:hypothetical protein
MGRPSGSARALRDAEPRAPAAAQAAAEWRNCLLEIAHMEVSVIDAGPILNGKAAEIAG